MNDGSILPLPSPEPSVDPLCDHLKTVPSDERMVNHVAELYERYKKVGKARQFVIRRYGSDGVELQGLLLALTDQYAVFWRNDHFWIPLAQLAFSHPAAQLRGSNAPFIDQPVVGASYIFSKPNNATRISAERISLDSLLQAYLALVTPVPKPPGSSKSGKKDEEDGSLDAAFHPNDGLDLLGP